jgi:opacity protein-like surface antigen
MKITKLATLAAVAALAMSAAHADDFEGAYVTLKGGLDHAKASGDYQADKKNVGSGGAELGNRWGVGHGLLIGTDAFFDYNARATHDTASGGTTKFGSNVYGADFTAGTVLDSKWYLYGKLGAAHVRGIDDADGFSKTALHYGTGVAYEVAPRWTVGTEYTNTHAKEHDTHLNNDNVMLTVSYDFGKVVH